jgi:predicted N-acyltransferase
MNSDTIEPLTVEFATTLASIDPVEWDSIAGDDYPFLRHRFLLGLEETGCTTADSGWQPCHVVLRRGTAVIAVMPMYLKSHSYGEYVFDWSWADAWHRSGLNYYPKLVSAIPFTPATGPRLCIGADEDKEAITKTVLQAIQELASKRDISSWHVLFPDQTVSEQLLNLGMHQRIATQFHWFNADYETFDDFLATFNSRKRKNLRRERQRVVEQGLRLETRTGDEISAGHWQQFHTFYQLTYAKRSGHGGYLTREFFTQTAAAMGDQVVMVLAYHGDTPVAGALYFRSSDTLFGRYWGCEHEFDCLHFEACYYQGIEYCIANGLQRFDPGAQGEHKIQRGFHPVQTYSNHWIADPQLSAAVGDFTRREVDHVEAYREQAATLLPFKQTS